MNTAKDIIQKLIDEIPETKAGEVIDFLMFLKGKKEQDLYLRRRKTLIKNQVFGSIV